MCIDTAFTALADPTRRALLERLETGEHTLTDFAQVADGRVTYRSLI